MKVIAVGSLAGMDLEDLDDQPGVLLTGTIEEIRKVGALLYLDVVVRKRKATDPTPSEGKGDSDV